MPGWTIMDLSRRSLAGLFFMMAVTFRTEAQEVSPDHPRSVVMALAEAMDRRMSTRSFSEKTVEEDKLAWILQAMAKTWKDHTVPGRILVRTNGETVGYDPVDPSFGEYTADPFSNLRTYGAPVRIAIIETDSMALKEREKLFFWRGMAGQAVYLGSAAMGLGAVTIGGLAFDVGYPDSQPVFREHEKGPAVLSTSETLSLERAFERWQKSSREDSSDAVEAVGDLCWGLYGYSRLVDGSGRIHRTVPSANGRYPMVVTGRSDRGMFRYQPETHQIIRVGTEDRFASLSGIPELEWVHDAPLCFSVSWDTTRLSSRSMALYEAGAMVANAGLLCAVLDLPMTWSLLEPEQPLPGQELIPEGYIPLVMIGLVKAYPERSSFWRDGSFTGSCEEWPKMTVSVNVRGGRITDIHILEDFGTPEFSAEAKAVIPSRIIATGNVDIDVVSGATMSSRSLLKAVGDALRKAR